MESNLRIYSLGIVVETKPKNTDIVLVSPVEVFNIQSPGFIKDTETTFKGNLPDINDESLETEIKASNYLRAQWLSIGNDNRITPPDVVKGETVLIFKYDNVDEYYWVTLFREPGLRRQEDVVYAYCNLKKGTDKFDKKTSYWVEYNTKDKYIRLHTSDNDGEPTTYDISLNTKKGILTILDKQNNSIHLDSVKSELTIKTNTKLTITSPNVVINGNVTINGGLSSTGDINSDGSIIDAGGNTNHHSHP